MVCCLLTIALACCHSRRPSAAVQSGRSRSRRVMLTKDGFFQLSAWRDLRDVCAKHWDRVLLHKVRRPLNIESVKLWQLRVSHLIIQKSKCCLLATNNGLLSRPANWVMDSVMFNSSCYSSKVQTRCFINLLVSKEIVFTLPSWQVGWAQVLGGFWPSFITTHLCTADRTPSLAYLCAELLLL